MSDAGKLSGGGWPEPLELNLAVETNAGATAIIVFAHGSSVPEANRQITQLAKEVARRAQCPVSCAFLELAQPDLATAVARAVGAGTRQLVVIPYFLTMGLHVREDLPRLIEQQRASFPQVEIRVGESLEGHPGMAEAVLARAHEVLGK